MKTFSDKETAIQLLALCRFAGADARLIDSLARTHGHPGQMLEFEPSLLSTVPGISASAGDALSHRDELLAKAEKYYDDLARREIKIVSRFAEDYPPLLFELNDPPPLLYVRGRVPSEIRTVALVGAIEASAEGMELTADIARKLVAVEIQIVASMNQGIDAAAHLACATASGISYAVADTGFDQLLDHDNMPLAIDVASSGGIISEHPPDYKAKKSSFKRSNRLVAGMSKAVVVTEVYSDSRRTIDLMLYCQQIGKLLFIVADPKFGALSDKKALDLAQNYGAIPIKGIDRMDEIIASLV